MEENGKKKRGRNQEIAIYGYGIPVALTFLACVGAAVKGGDGATALASLDKWIGFVMVYVPVAMGSILFVSGAIKTVAALKKSAPK